MANGNGDNGSLVGKLVGSLDNKLILLLVASLVGVSGNQILLKTNPETARPNPWTSIQAKEAHDDLRDEIRELERHIEQHSGRSAHREQMQLNREIIWRLEKLEKPNSDAK